MNGETLLEIPTVAERVRSIEYVRVGIWKLVAEEGGETVDDLELTEPMQTWLDRMRAALVDESVSQASFGELRAAFDEYRRTLKPREAGELHRRVQEFDECKLAIVKATR